MGSSATKETVEINASDSIQNFSPALQMLMADIELNYGEILHLDEDHTHEFKMHRTVCLEELPRLYLDLNKRVYNHAPGECHTVAAIENGAVDIDIIKSTGTALVSTGLRLYNRTYTKERTRGGSLYAFNSTSMTSWEVTMKSQTLTKQNFNPHGISVWEDKSGRIFVFVVNHRTKYDTVELFRFKDTDKEKVLTHLKTIKSPLLHNLRDVAAVDWDKFYATSYHYFWRPWLQNVELYLGLDLGSVLYFDGKNTTHVKRWIATPTGLALDMNKKFLYVSSFVNENIQIFAIQPDRNLTKTGEIALKSSPYNLVVDRLTADLYVACQPSKLRFFRHETAPKDYYAASQIVRIRGRPSKMLWTFTQMYVNDGGTISGATVGARLKGSLIIGSAFNNMLTCELSPSNLI